jgi:hypothetical protein
MFRNVKNRSNNQNWYTTKTGAPPYFDASIVDEMSDVIGKRKKINSLTQNERRRRRRADYGALY